MNMVWIAGNLNRRITRLMVVSLVWLGCGTGPCHGSGGNLETVSGDTVAGSLADADASNLAWQHPGFAQPFKFEAALVKRISQPRTDQKQIAEGAFGIELVQGERLYGDIIDIDDEWIQIRTSDIGDLSIKRSHILALSAWNNGEAVVYQGPRDIASWKAEGNWTDLGGTLTTSELGASIVGDVPLPEIADIQLEVSWQETPNFVIALGVDPKKPDESSKKAFRIEVWQDQVVALWESDAVADIVLLGNVESMAGQLRVMVRLDQPNQRAEIYSEAGLMLGQLTLPKQNSTSDRSCTGLRVHNIRGQVRVDSIQVLKSPTFKSHALHSWPDIALNPVPVLVSLTDDSILIGNWISVDDEYWMFQREGEEERQQRIKSSDILQVEFAQSQTPPELSTEVSETTFRLSTFKGQRLAGRYLGVIDGRLQFHPNVSLDPTTLALSDLRTLNQTVTTRNANTSSRLERRRLIAEGTNLRGRFVPTSANESANDSTGAMRFEPMGASPADMLDDFSGRYVIRSTTPIVKTEPPQSPPRPVRPPQGVFGFFVRAFGNNPATQSKTPPSLSLRTGEVIPASVSRIDETNVHFKSEMSAVTKIPSEIIESVRLQSGQYEPTLEEIERERLLMVPRMRKRNPPTHLLIGVNGDVLRCRFIALDEQTLTIETRLETITIERQHVAQIIWLGTRGEDRETEQRPDGLYVKAKLFNGHQLGIVPEQVTELEIVGANPFLDETRIQFARIDELFFGDAAWKEALPKSSSLWELTDAPEPEIIEGGGGDRGTASPLVGETAPEFKLQLLDGTTFALSEQKGKVVVLDFWATWCGPCLQAMPTIEATASKFDSDEVILVAVNLQESPATIKPILERLKIDPLVALDIDGVAGQRYQANAIPQTVVIDRNGNVQKVFVGGGSGLAENLENAITDCLASPDGT
ncbi:Thiol-disulfide oxidoreductase ResA [Novipirellula aureliae]|uniref:Thiol-disulfide oxidoreductase ResA n=2 Tax=Novipirellula aureliae TaxID=2527966 RepID=A0A5C6E5B3_9BACT|nr:Thiol-disulfide oxidoreductase ResA [Novipirellula aureliae]